MISDELNTTINNDFLKGVSDVLLRAQKNAKTAVNLSMVYAYFEIGRMIVEEEQHDRFFEQRKKAFTKAIAAALLKDGKVKIKGMYSTKTGKTFDGVVLLADTGGKYVNFRVEQNRK